MVAPYCSRTLAYSQAKACVPRAAPTKSAKTELVAFDNSPFPYSGQPPGQDKPFYDLERDGRRGHTSPRGGVYWEDLTYSDRRVLLHIPRGFNPALPALMIVYLHGNMTNLEGVVYRHQQVPRQVSESGLNAVLVAPQFAVNALDSSPGRFYEAGHFRRFVEEAGVRLARLNGDARARAAIESLPVILVAYSGGYAPAAWAVHHGGIGDRLRGVILLDALYAELDKFGIGTTVLCPTAVRTGMFDAAQAIFSAPSAASD